MRREQALPETIAALDAEKSNLLLEAYTLFITNQPDEAIERYALAAPMEERIAAFYEQQGDPIMAARSWFSAAVCYAKSGSLREALRLVDALGRGSDALDYYKTDALLWAGRLHQQQRDTLQVCRQPLQPAL